MGWAEVSDGVNDATAGLVGETMAASARGFLILALTATAAAAAGFFAAAALPAIAMRRREPENDSVARRDEERLKEGPRRVEGRRLKDQVEDASRRRRGRMRGRRIVVYLVASE
jgi:hypothetical protein